MLQVSSHGGKYQGSSQMWRCFEKKAYARSNSQNSPTLETHGTKLLLNILLSSFFLLILV